MKKYKILLWTLALGWAGLSFYLLGQKIESNSTARKAENSLQMTQSFFKEYSKQIKFKLGQWVYNYQLKKSKGVEFDEVAFMDSNFDLIGFYSLNPIESDLYIAQWTKAKDFSSQELPTSIVDQLEGWSFEQAKKEPYRWFSGLGEQGQSFVVMAFAVDDPALGQGLLVGALDMEYMPYESLSRENLILDQQGRYILHPQKEYLAQKSSVLTRNIPEGKLVKLDGEVFLQQAQAGNVFVYRADQTSMFAFLAWPMLILLLGVGLFAGLPLLLYEENETSPHLQAFRDKSQSSESSDIDLAGYESVLKVQSLREKLNQMSLLSSSLKGRLDLVTRGEADHKTLADLKSDFESLDTAIDQAFHVAAEDFPVEVEAGTVQEDIRNQNHSESAQSTELTEPRTEIVETKTLAQSTDKDEVSQRGDGFAFEISEADIDVDFAENLSLSPVENKDTDKNSETSETTETTEQDIKAQAAADKSTGVIKESASGASGVTSVSESLLEAKFALGDLGSEEDPFGDLEELQEIDLTSGSEGATGEATEYKASKNDWSKVIEELTEELNNLNLDLLDENDDDSQELAQTSVNSQKPESKTTEKITPPRIEL